MTFSLVDGGGSACRGTSAGDNMPEQLGSRLCLQNVQHSVILIRPCQRTDLRWIMLCHVHTFARHFALLHRSPPRWSCQLHRWNLPQSRTKLQIPYLAADLLIPVYDVYEVWDIEPVEWLHTEIVGWVLIWLGLAWLPILFCDPRTVDGDFPASMG